MYACSRCVPGLGRFLGATGLTIVSIICLELPYPVSDKRHILQPASMFSYAVLIVVDGGVFASSRHLRYRPVVSSALQSKCRRIIVGHRFGCLVYSLP